jgi:hypothetical protein
MLVRVYSCNLNEKLNIEPYSSTVLVDLALANASFTIANISNPQDVQEMTSFNYTFASFDTSDMTTDQLFPSTNETFVASFLMELLHAKNPNIPLSSWNMEILQGWLQDLWRTYWALYASQNMRISLAQEEGGGQNNATYTYTQSRIRVARGPTRAIQGLTGAILLAVIAASLSIPSVSPLPKPPFSIASRMSLLAGSHLVELRDFTRRGAQTMSTAEMRRMLSGYQVRLGWWDTPDGRRRYGIDVTTLNDQEKDEESETTAFVPLDRSLPLAGDRSHAHRGWPIVQSADDELGTGNLPMLRKSQHDA